jgi:hypothetical protein
MSNTTKVLTTLLGAALVAPTLVLASDFSQVVNGEAGVIFKDAPSTITREQVRAEMAANKTPTDGAWKFVGGEAGWINNAPHYVFNGGMMAHASDCPMVTAAAAPRPAERSSEPLPGYTGA